MPQDIYIMKADKVKLLELIDKTAYIKIRTDANLKALESEINRAGVIDGDMTELKFIKMNSRVLMTIDQDEEEITLVYPEDADIKNNKISVFSPIGTAILGYCEGSCIQWNVPSGSVHIQIRKIIDLR